MQQPIKEASACGFVTDASGIPIPAATVNATDGAKTAETATTLGDGSFRFLGMRNVAVDLDVQAPGFNTGRNHVGRMLEADGRKCGHPIYIVLATGPGNSFITNKKSELPKPKLK